METNLQPDVSPRSGRKAESPPWREYRVRAAKKGRKVTAAELLRTYELSSVHTSQDVLPLLLDRLQITLERDDNLAWIAAAKCGRTQARIFVHGRDSLEHQRFSAAHQLGHILRDWDRSEFAETNFDGPGCQDANRFAHELLLPEALVRREYMAAQERGETTLAPLAKLFGVTQATLEVRLRQVL